MAEINFKIYFSDFFEVNHEKIEKYGALDISLICDNPAFVDPFLIFFSSKSEYKELHKNIIEYISYLKEKSDEGLFEERNAIFSEVKEVWLGFSKNSNLGIGLNKHFANELKNNLSSLLSRGGGITKSSHLEKLCLIGDRVGADKISDFTLNLIKSFLIDYTQKFAQKNIDEKYLCNFNVPRSVFDYNFGEWNSKIAKLPFIINKKGKKEFVLLTPKDILVKENGWITKNDYLEQDTTIINKITNDELKEKINKYFIGLMPKKRDKKTGEITIDDNKANRQKALIGTTLEFPVLLDYYIKDKEENGDKSLINNASDVSNIETYLYQSIKTAIGELNKKQFYEKEITSFDEVIEKVKSFKHYLEERDSYKIFWDGEELRIRESDAQIMLDLMFNASGFSVDKEVNNGRGPVDFKVSKGKDSTLIEVKLASNSQIKSNLQKQL
ncbi:MAG: hypothetical protein PHS92_03685, partial [Candidatus Gracilibacteria bacterium]|nr:hypothetical protein [Candidatus Gracilibacteria bacterium]